MATGASQRDSEMTASELRARYSIGGTAKDTELSAGQLRARYGIHSNRQNWSTGDTDNRLFIAAAVGIALAVIVYLLR